ncbi:MAG: SWIM zinc finger family protein, partial [Saprospiraceae bacterium]
MSIPNQLIETIYDEELVLQAEALFENEAITDISKVNRNFFIAKIKDGKSYEVVIQSPFTKKQKATCDCNFFASNLICKHVITLLFHIRSTQSQKPLVGNKKSGSSSAKNTSLNIHQILHEISHDDLVTFMKAYATKDKKFSTQLKVSFARKIEVEDGAMKYKNILNSIVRPYTGKQSKASATDVKAILSVL